MANHVVAILISVLLSLVSLDTGGQNPPAQTSAPPAGKSDYSKEAYVIEEYSDSFVFENDGTGSQLITFRVRVQSDSGVQQYGLLKVRYAKEVSTVEIGYIRVRKPDGTVIPTPSENIQEMPSQVTSQAPQYSDLYEKHIPVRGLSPGDVLEYQITIHTIHPDAPGQFWLSFQFSQGVIVLHEELKINVPRGRKVNMKSLHVQPTVTEGNGRTIYTWTNSFLERKTKPEEKPDDARRRELGRLQPHDVQLSSFESWAEVGKWYDALQRDRIMPNPEILAKAAELTKGAANDLEKLRAIYNFVSLQYRYIGVEFGIGRFQPHHAGEVYANHYGDCKDKHTLLAALAHAAGLRVVPALIQSSYELDPDVPSPGQFDHVISVLLQGDALLWMDSTPEVAPLGQLAAALRGKPALLIPGEGVSSLVLTPEKPVRRNLVGFRLEGKMSEAGKLEARVELTPGGDYEVALRAAFRRAAEVQWKELVQAVAGSLGFGGTVSDVSVSAPEKIDAPLRITYNYTRDDYSGWSDRHYRPPLPTVGLPDLKSENEKSKEPFWLGFVPDIQFESVVEVPKGYSFGPLPAETHAGRSLAQYSAIYTVEGNKITTRRLLSMDLLEVVPASFDDYKKLVRAVDDDDNILINVNSDSDSGAGPAVSGADEILVDSENADAIHSYNQGRERLAQRDYRGGMDYLKEAVGRDSKFSAPWIALGASSMGMGNSEEAIKDLRKAIELNPRQLLAYKILAPLLEAKLRSEDAVQIYKDLLKVARTTPKPLRDSVSCC